MQENAKILASGLKALEKQVNECDSLQARLQAKASKDESIKKAAEDLKACLGTLKQLLDDIRAALAVAECLDKADDPGKHPEEIAALIGRADSHLDGLKAVKKRLLTKLAYT